MKKNIKLLIKISITVALLYFLFSKIDIDRFGKILKNINLGWFIVAFIFFNLSKIVSSIRLNYYFKDLGLKLSEKTNLTLYYVGMFYNLFLPGGIGGDGYKIYILNKKYQTGIKPLFLATLLDRISGVVALGFFAGILFCFSSFTALHYSFVYLSAIFTIFLFPIFLFLHKKFFVNFSNSLKKTTYLALIVQLLQIISAYFLVLSIGGDGIINFLTIFLISSVVAIIPLTVGGVGAREFTFFYAFGIIDKDINSGFAFSILFFILTMLSSFIGIFFLNKKI